MNFLVLVGRPKGETVELSKSFELSGMVNMNQAKLSVGHWLEPGETVMGIFDACEVPADIQALVATGDPS